MPTNHMTGEFAYNHEEEPESQSENQESIYEYNFYPNEIRRIHLGDIEWGNETRDFKEGDLVLFFDGMGNELRVIKKGSPHGGTEGLSFFELSEPAVSDTDHTYVKKALEELKSKGIITGAQHNGQSSVVERNFWSLEGIPDAPAPVYIIKGVEDEAAVVSVDTDTLNYDLKKGNLQISKKPLQILVPDQNAIKECFNEVKKQRLIEAQELLNKYLEVDVDPGKRIKDVYEIREFNHGIEHYAISQAEEPEEVLNRNDGTLSGRRLTGKYNEFYIITYATTRNNQTATFIRVGEKIRCPKELAGRVIGKGGVNIKAMQKAFKLNTINVVEVR
jgi:hypothetical protein